MAKYKQEAPMEVYPVRLTAKHAREARSLGDGNLSEGVRKAIETAQKEAVCELCRGCSKPIS